MHPKRIQDKKKGPGIRQRVGIVLCAGFVVLLLFGILLYGRSMAGKPIAVESAAVERRPVLMVAVSSSVPMPSVQQYVRDTGRLRGQVVLRGWVGTGPEAFERTVSWVREATGAGAGGDSGGGVAIDPLLFEKLPIERVPATVLMNAAGLACLQDPRCSRVVTSDYAIVYGNVTLAYALQVIALRGGVHSSTAHRMVQALHAP